MAHQPTPMYSEAGTGACTHGTDGRHDRHEPAGDFWICLDARTGNCCDTHDDEWGYGIPWGYCRDGRAES